jgi:hypothetical protein
MSSGGKREVTEVSTHEGKGGKVTSSLIKIQSIACPPSSEKLFDPQLLRGPD